MLYHFRHQRWKSYVLNLSINAVGRVCRFSLFILSGSSLKLLSQLVKKTLQALLLSFLLYSWHLYALPRDNNRSDAIMLPPAPFIMFATPNLATYRFLHGGDWDGLAPTAHAFSASRGFYYLQLYSPSSYELNFPTTGMNGLYFDLILGGDANDLIWDAPVTHEGITATVTNITLDDSQPYKDCPAVSYGNPIPCRQQFEGKAFARVTLNGPFADDTQINSDNPVPVFKPSLPQTFELVGRNRHNEEVVRYGFVLKHWFVYRNKEGSQSEQTAWCSAIGYRMPRVKDLTNVKCGKMANGHEYNFPCLNGIDGAFRPPINYREDWAPEYGLRYVDTGLVTEWGLIGGGLNPNPVVAIGYNWTSDSNFIVNWGGSVTRSMNSVTLAGICVHP
ncbi:hypothetical protein A9G29_03810 [Gilliamella sp. Fer2-1]|jgi:hypothetical protein|nr:hypothetical protein A9G29_03810 [Gilliamella apicola]